MDKLPERTYLARADFVESYECESLCKHGAGKVFLSQQERHHDQRKQDLRDKSEGLDMEA